MIVTAGVGGQWRATCATMAIVLGLDSDAPAQAVGFDRLIEVEYARVLVLMQVVVGEAQRAEQLTLDACVSLRRHWRTVSTAERPDVWLRATALRAAIGRDRRARLGEALHLRGRDAQRQPTSPHQGAAVVAALSALSVQQRAAVALQVLEGRSVAEIAEILACRPATAAGYVSAAKYAMAGSLGLSATDPELVGVLRDALHAAAGDDPPDVDAARLAIARLEERHASRRRSRFALAGVGVVAVLLAAGLLNHPWRDDHQGPQPLPAAVSVSGLYGLWRADVANADQSMLVTMTPSSLGGGFTAYPKCGELDGTLAVTSLGGFAAAVDGSGGRCTLRNGTPQAMQWLEQVYRVEPVGPGWTLLDAAGNTVATLSRADIREFPHAIDLLPIRELGHVPALALDERVALDQIVTVPQGATAAQSSDLVGTWYPPDPSTAFLQFYADGRYDASDGWHCLRGRWSMDAAGQLAFARGLNVKCADAGERLQNVPQWFDDADVVGRSANTLQLYDDTGRVVRTVSSTQQSTPPSSSS
jgi:RNA polymerase sigma-70 factor (ECF subfamily)